MKIAKPQKMDETKCFITCFLPIGKQFNLSERKRLLVSLTFPSFTETRGDDERVIAVSET